ncbi:MAG: sigma-70 family RNA polymerase sigma factor [Bacteroidota bacterium]
MSNPDTSLPAGRGKNPQGLAFTDKRFAKELFEQNLGLVPYGCHRYGLSPEDAYDVYVDSVVEVLAQLQDGRFRSECALETYLFQIFRFRCIKALRGKAALPKPVSFVSLVDRSSSDPGPESSLEIRDALDQLKSRCDRLNHRLWKILEDLIIKGYDLEEIAQRVGLKSGACVASVKWRYMKRLRLGA